MSQLTSTCPEEQFRDVFYFFFGISRKYSGFSSKKDLAGYSKLHFMCPDDSFGKSWWKTYSSTFFGVRGHNPLISGKSIPAGVYKLPSRCPREHWDESFFFERYFFRIFRILLISFQNLQVIFWYNCQCCEVCVLRSNLSVHFVLIKEMKFIFQFDKVCEIYWDLLNCSLYECHICRLLVQRNVLRNVFR